MTDSSIYSIENGSQDQYKCSCIRNVQIISLKVKLSSHTLSLQGIRVREITVHVHHTVEQKYTPKPCFFFRTKNNNENMKSQNERRKTADHVLNTSVRVRLRDGM